MADLLHTPKKHSRVQMYNETIEKELLSICTTLQEFLSILLLGTKIHIFADDKHLTFKNLPTQRVLKCRIYVEDYSPILDYIEGAKNILADKLSRLHHLLTRVELANTTRLTQTVLRRLKAISLMSLKI